MNVPARISVPELVINWHMTEVCNYSCRYCYAKWGSEQPRDEVSRCPERTRKLLNQLADYFLRNRKELPLYGRMPWGTVRLNFAGGEPLLFPRQFNYALETANLLGMRTSIITNGSGITSSNIEFLAERLSMIGVSLDSTSSVSNRLIGRSDPKQRQIDLPYLASLLEQAREINPEIRIKVNTVVNRANMNDDLSELLDSIKPDKWKVLKMLPLLTEDLEITDQEFEQFVSRHSRFSKILYAESNTDMEGSYLMLDPLGRFFQNSRPGSFEDYLYSRPIEEVGVDAAVTDMPFDAEKFANRYRRA